MECPMCYELYDSEDKTPRNLNCGHTVCEGCLNIVYEKKKFLDCPTCRFKHDPQIKPNSLTKNYIALQLACHKKEMRKNYEFCPNHDEPYRFLCEQDQKYLCVQCISDHAGHKFIKQDQSFFTAKKNLSEEIESRDNYSATLKSIENEYIYLKHELLNSYEENSSDLDMMFHFIKNMVTEEHYKRKEELRKFYENQLEDLTTQENQVEQELCRNQAEKIKLQEQLGKLEKEKKVDDKFVVEESPQKPYTKPSIVQFPVLVTPFSGTQSFVQICHKISPKICFFGQRRKLLTLCPITNTFNITTINNAQIQYYASACTLPTGQILITGGGSSNNCFLFSPKQPNLLEKKKNMVNCRKEHSCVYLNGNVYVISGYDGKNKGMAGCEAYDIFREEWKITKSLIVPRCAFAATVSGGKIYVFGGYDGKDRLSSIEVFNPETGNWTLLSTKLHFPLSNAAAVSQGKNIYILGGGWSEGFNQQIFKFNTQSHEMQKFQKMNKGRDLRNKSIKFKNQIYTIGGNFYDGEKLDLRTSQWSDIKPYNDLVNDNLDSWCCALSYSSHDYELQKCQDIGKMLKKKYKEYPDSHLNTIQDQDPL